MLLISGNLSAQASQYSLVSPAGYEGDGLPVGEGLWIIITVIFSVALNIYLRKRENKPEKVAVKELKMMLVQKRFGLRQEIFAGMTPSISKSRIVKTLRRRKKRVRIFHPLDTLNLVGKHEQVIPG